MWNKQCEESLCTQPAAPPVSLFTVTVTWTMMKHGSKSTRLAFLSWILRGGVVFTNEYTLHLFLLQLGWKDPSSYFNNTNTPSVLRVKTPSDSDKRVWSCIVGGSKVTDICTQIKVKSVSWSFMWWHLKQLRGDVRVTRRQDEDMAVLTGRKLQIFLCVKMYILKVLQSYSKYYLPDVGFQKLHHVVPNRKCHHLHWNVLCGSLHLQRQASSDVINTTANSIINSIYNTTRTTSLFLLLRIQSGNRAPLAWVQLITRQLTLMQWLLFGTPPSLMWDHMLRQTALHLCCIMSIHWRVKMSKHKRQGNMMVTSHKVWPHVSLLVSGRRWNGSIKMSKGFVLPSPSCTMNCTVRWQPGSMATIMITTPGNCSQIRRSHSISFQGVYIHSRWTVKRRQLFYPDSSAVQVEVMVTQLLYISSSGSHSGRPPRWLF